MIRNETGTNGGGTIGVFNNFEGTMSLLNQGLVSSHVSGRFITIGAQNVTNAGTFEATNGGTLIVPIGYTQTGGVTRVNNGTVNTTLTLRTFKSDKPGRG